MTNSFYAYLAGLASQLLALALAFDWVNWSTDQQAIVLLVAGTIIQGIVFLNNRYGKAGQIRRAAAAQGVEVSKL